MPLMTLLRASPYIAILILLGVVAFQSDKIHYWKQAARNCELQRQADRAGYEQAQAEAAKANAEHVAQVEKQQQQVTDEISRDLETRLARLRAELLRQSSVKGSSGGAGASVVPGAAEGATGQAGLCLAPEELLHAAESEERHDQLINWVEQQMKVRR